MAKEKHSPGKAKSMGSRAQMGSGKGPGLTRKEPGFGVRLGRTKSTGAMVPEGPHQGMKGGI